MKQRHEDKLQRACVQLLQLYENQGHLRFFHPANGGFRRPIESKILKGLGVKAGIVDLVIMLASYEYVGVRAPPSKPHVLFCELKSEKGVLSEAQKGWRDWLLKAGFEWFEIRNVDQLANILHERTSANVAQSVPTRRPSLKVIPAGKAKPPLTG